MGRATGAPPGLQGSIQPLKGPRKTHKILGGKGLGSSPKIEPGSLFEHQDLLLAQGPMGPIPEDGLELLASLLEGGPGQHPQGVLLL